VQIAAAELGLSVDRPLTVTGGLSFAGGPWNNYVTHAIATMVERLRADEAAMGMVTANGGYLTKHAFGIFSSAPPPSGFRHANLQAEVDAMPSRQAADVVDGPVAVESAVVVHGRDQQPERAVVAALLADGRRAWGGSSDEDTMDRFLAEETSGAEGHLGPDGTFRFGS
jgi:acetyl-CoA C-acetyltransferase